MSAKDTHQMRSLASLFPLVFLLRQPSLTTASHSVVLDQQHQHYLILGPHPNLPDPKLGVGPHHLCFSKTTGRFSYMTRFKKHWSIDMSA